MRKRARTWSKPPNGQDLAQLATAHNGVEPYTDMHRLVHFLTTLKS